MPGTYCVVYGCLNSVSSKPEISFFRLPADFERRCRWLRLISREDLMNKPPQNYTVCEEHFNAMDILVGTRRKKLKTNSLPSLHLPDLQKKDVQTLTDAPNLVEICTQTEKNITRHNNIDKVLNMPCCALRYCKNNSTNSNKSTRGITFHKFPGPESEYREKWIRFIQKDRSECWWLPAYHSCICSAHFSREHCYYTKSGRRYLTKNAVPVENPSLALDTTRDPLKSEPGSDSEIDVGCTAVPYTVKVEVVDTELDTNTLPCEDPDGCLLHKSEKASEVSKSESIFDSPTNTVLRSKLKKMTATKILYGKNVRKLKRQNEYLKRRNRKLEELVKKLKSKVASLTGDIEN